MCMGCRGVLFRSGDGWCYKVVQGFFDVDMFFWKKQSNNLVIWNFPHTYNSKVQIGKKNFFLIFGWVVRESWTLHGDSGLLWTVLPLGADDIQTKYWVIKYVDDVVIVSTTQILFTNSNFCYKELLLR